MSNKQNKVLGVIFLAGIVIWGGSLLVAKVFVPEANPAMRYSGTLVNPRVDAALKRACYDCHSNETKWPWYTHLPVVSVLVAHDVAEGREVLNFSEWASMDTEARTKAMSESAEEVQEGEMPMDIYARMHPEAQLSESERAWVVSFAIESTGATPGKSGGEGDEAGEDDDDE